ncbi:hypothetical protein PCE1_002231 [Barthelona sp. PCE]
MSGLLEKDATFEEFELDERLLRVLKKKGFENPTKVQYHTIPHILEGSDVFIEAATGSGKSLSFILPVLQRIIDSDSFDVCSAVFLLPTNELVEQLWSVTNEFGKELPKLRTCAITSELSEEERDTLVCGTFSVLFTTMTPFLRCLDMNLIDPMAIQFLTLDEADLLVEMSDLQDESSVLSKILSCISTTSQKVFSSATLNEGISYLNELYLNNHKYIQLKNAKEKADLETFFFKVEEERKKYWLLYSMLKFQLIKGKVLIFFNKNKTALRTSLFLHKMFVTHALVNDNVPFENRMEIIRNFNQGGISVLLLTDKVFERGIDFQNASVVLNFELPKKLSTFSHRVGRAGRAGTLGMNISFMLPENERTYDDFEINDFDYEKIGGIDYSVYDVLRRCTKKAVDDYNRRLISQEMKNSELIRSISYGIQDNEDSVMKKELRLNVNHRLIQREKAMKDLPEYLLRKDVNNELAMASSSVLRAVRQSLEQKKQLRKRKKNHQKKRKGNRNDPLRRTKGRRRK